MKIFKTGGKETMKKRRFAQLVLMITNAVLPDIWHSVCAAATRATTTTAKAAVKMAGKKRAVSIITTSKVKKLLTN